MLKSSFSLPSVVCLFPSDCIWCRDSGTYRDVRPFFPVSYPEPCFFAVRTLCHLASLPSSFRSTSFSMNLDFSLCRLYDFGPLLFTLSISLSMFLWFIEYLMYKVSLPAPLPSLMKKPGFSLFFSVQSY